MWAVRWSWHLSSPISGGSTTPGECDHELTVRDDHTGSLEEGCRFACLPGRFVCSTLTVIFSLATGGVCAADGSSCRAAGSSRRSHAANQCQNETSVHGVLRLCRPFATTMADIGSRCLPVRSNLSRGLSETRGCPKRGRSRHACCRQSLQLIVVGLIVVSRRIGRGSIVFGGCNGRVSSATTALHHAAIVSGRSKHTMI